MIKRIVDEKTKRVSVEQKNNLLLTIADILANSGKFYSKFLGNVSDEVKIVKDGTKFISCEINGIEVKIGVTIPKKKVDGEVIAIATCQDDK